MSVILDVLKEEATRLSKDNRALRRERNQLKFRVTELEAKAVPEGYALVQIKPRQEMIEAIHLLCDDLSAFDDAESFWKFLLCAAEPKGGE